VNVKQLGAGRAYTPEIDRVKHVQNESMYIVFHLLYYYECSISWLPTKDYDEALYA
jgi:hypothetical protein